MRFRDHVSLDTSQIADRRGIAAPLVGGGGLLGVVVLLITIFTGGDPTGLVAGESNQAQTSTDLGAECRTGADANRQADCRIVGVVNSVQAFWTKQLPNYTEARTTFFTGGTQTGCGAASSEVGPFYCPADRKIYIDLAFYEQLRTQFGASGGVFAEAYVIAHEYGHHVENQLGILGRAQDGSTGPSSASVRVELMADCLAGMWGKGAMETGFIEALTDRDIADGLNAAAAVGDDRIQQRARGTVDQESFTHGSAQQRQRWFQRGYRATSLNECNTFTGASL